MDETLVWIPITIAEVLLLVSIALGVFLTRARKAERHLRRQLEELEQVSHRAAAVAVPKETPATAPVMAQLARSEAPPADFEGFGAHRKLDQLLPATATGEIDHGIDLLQQRLHETSECLQRVTAELQKERTFSELSQLELADLRQNLTGLAHELTALRHANARLQQELRSKKDILDGAVLADRGSKEKILLYIKRLRDELATLQLKLSVSEADVFRLREEKEALSSDYKTLTREYERIYANFRQ